MNRMVGKIKVN